MWDAINEVLDAKDPSLKRAWMRVYGQGLGMTLDADMSPLVHNQQIVDNVIEFYRDLPANSPVRTSFLQQLFRGVPAESVAKYLDIEDRTVYKSRDQPAKPPSYYLVNLGIPRDRLGKAEDFAIEWCESLQEASGKLRKCYFGLFKSMYAEYYAWCVKEKHPYVSPEILERIRRDRRVWILKGDIFLVCFRFLLDTVFFSLSL